MKINKLNLKAQKIPSVAILFLLVAPFIVLSYAFYIYNPAHADNLWLYIALLVGDTIGMLAVLGLWLTILLDIIVPEHHEVQSAKDESKFLATKPTVDILITVYGEPLAIIEKTLNDAINVRYRHKTFILDDKADPEVEKICNKYGAYYIKRTSNEHAKAGNINHGLKLTNAEFFLILDADQRPNPDIIEELLPYMADEKLAFVQSPQVFRNVNQFIASGTSQAQEIFYKYVQPAKNISNSVFSVGTNVLFRRAAIDDIGGLAQISHSEDLWTSYHLHEKGWKSLFVNKTLAIGIAPDTIKAYFNQQLRWAKGGLEMLIHQNPFASKTLSLDQKIQYFFSNAFFLVGIPIFLYTILPLLYLLFDLKPLNTSGTWLIHYLPYVFVYYFLSWIFLSKLHISNISVSIASFYPYILALFSVIFEKDHKWVSTTSFFGKISEKIRWIWPHIFIMALTIPALFVGWYEPKNIWVTILYSILSLWNFYLLYVFVSGERRLIKQ